MNSVNLLPAATAARYRRKRLQGAWLQVVGATAALALCTTVAGQLVSAHKTRKRHGFERVATHSLETVRRNDELQRRLRLVSQRRQQQTLLRSVYSPLPLLALLTEVKDLLNGRMEVESVDFALVDPKAKSSPTKTDEHGHATITIKSDSASSAARIVELMRDDGMFKDVEMQSALEQLNNQNGDLRFSLRASF